MVRLLTPPPECDCGHRHDHGCTQSGCECLECLMLFGGLFQEVPAGFFFSDIREMLDKKKGEVDDEAISTAIRDIEGSTD